MTNKSMIDMTQGNPFSQIVKFTLPMLIGNVFQLLYNTVDAIVVGRFVGMHAFAAVGTSFPVFFLLLSFIFGLNMGSGVVISQFYGAGKLEEVRRSVTTSVIFQLVCVAVMTVVGLVILEPLFRLMQVPAEIMADALIYARIFFYGLVFMFGYNILAGILRSLGDSRTPLYFLIISTILSIALSIWFVVSLRWGVAGVAWATLIAQAISMVLCYMYIIKNIPLLTFTTKQLVYDHDIMRSIIRLAIPSSVQQMIISLGFITVQGLVNTHGTATMAAFSAGGKVDSYATMPIMNFGQAISTYAGQNVGAWKIDRVRQGVRSTIIICLGLCLVTSVLVFTFGPNLIAVFLDADVEENITVIYQGVDFIRTVSIFYIVFAVSGIMNGVLRGTGDAITPMVSSFLNLGLRVGCAYYLTSIPEISFRGLWWSIPIGWTAGALVPIYRYLSGKWIENARNRYEQMLHMTKEQPPLVDTALELDI